jgi:hypothetical protein
MSTHWICCYLKIKDEDIFQKYFIRCNLLGHASIVVKVILSLWHMHIYPFGARVNGKHRPCGPQGNVSQGSKI